MARDTVEKKKGNQLKQLESCVGPLKDWYLYHLRGKEDHYIGDDCWKVFMEHLNSLLSDDKPDLTIIKEICQNGLKSKIKEIEAFYYALAKDQEELVCRYRPDRTLNFVNDSYCRYFGKSPTQLVGHNFIPLIPEMDQKRVQDQMASLSQENPVNMIEHRAIMPNGEIRWLRWLIRKVFDNENRFVGYQAKGQDITELKAINGNKSKAS